MSELIRMRQRIKTVETIKKITHAMRLIAMSSHARLRLKKQFFQDYQQEINKVVQRITHTIPLKHPLLTTSSQDRQRTLAIVIGSQKGLCGSFNTALVVHALHEFSHIPSEQLDIVLIGKKLHDTFISHPGTIIKHFDQFTAKNLTSINQEILSLIYSSLSLYRSVIVISHYPKSFFVQRAHTTSLIPLQDITTSSPATSQDYIFEQDPQVLIDYLVRMLLDARLHDLLFQSLIAEQAARFIAMDSSTRNATTLLDTMRLNYNKMRQSKITRELTDLIASF